MANKERNTTKKSILIIEDEHPLSTALQIKLSEAGYDVKVAEDGEEGLEHIQKEKFDLILLDIIMPKLNGFSFLEILKKTGADKGQVIMILSNLGQKEDIQHAKELGAQEYLVKANSSIKNIIDHICSIMR